MIDTKTAPYAVLALRVTTGALFLFHGLVKLMVFTPAGTAGYFESIGLPGSLGYLTMLVEIMGGIALILGIKTRLVSAALVPVLLGTRLYIGISEVRFRQIVLGLLTLSGCALLVASVPRLLASA